MLAASGTGSQHAPFITSPHPAVTGLPAPPQALANIDGWPSKEEVQDVLDIVFLNIGISQQLFDIRAFSDSLHLLYDGSTSQQPRLRIVEALLIFASGRLLQARPSDGPDLPGFALYKVAIQQLPSLPELRQEVWPPSTFRLQTVRRMRILMYVSPFSIGNFYQHFTNGPRNHSRVPLYDWP
jgi:hypothetical protein